MEKPRPNEWRVMEKPRPNEWRAIEKPRSNEWCAMEKPRPNEWYAMEKPRVRKVTTGITGVWQPSSHSGVAFRSFDVASSYH